MNMVDIEDFLSREFADRMGLVRDSHRTGSSEAGHLRCGLLDVVDSIQYIVAGKIKLTFIL